MYNTILYATDFDEVGVKAAHKANKIAKENNAQLFLMHVIEPLPAYAYPGFAGFEDVEKSIRDQAQQSLTSLAQELEIDKEQTLISLGSIKHEILRVAKEKAVDLIVTGSHGKHGVSLLLGSTATAILHGAQCDVLVVRHD